MGLLPFVTAYTISRLSNRRPVAAGLLLLTCIVFNCVVFQWVNYPGTTTRKAEPYNWQEIAGYTIAKNTAPDEYIFTNQQQEFIPMNWYAKRETIAVADSSEARMLLTRLKGKKAAYIEITGFKITRIIHLAKP
jgi:hypothetical protein